MSEFQPHPVYRVQVSEFGQVKGPSGKVLKWVRQSGKHDRPMVTLYLGHGKWKRVTVASLVCETFHGPRLSELDVRAIRRARAEGVPLLGLSAKYGVTPSTISSVARRKTWGHVS